MPMEETEANPSKFVIRKLPPNLCEADFRKMLTDVCQEELEWFRYHPGSFTNAGIRTSTAFIKLKHPELAPVLSQVLLQTPFSGEHGVQYHSEMGVALFQKVPKEREKKDPYMGTYQDDPFYEQFLKEMEEEDAQMSKGPTVSATTTIQEEDVKETIITPLMQHVIDAHNPKISSSRRQRASSGSGGRASARDSAQEKENQKRPVLPSISEGTAGDGKSSISNRADAKKSRDKKGVKDAAGSATVKESTASQKKIKTRTTSDSETSRSSKKESKRESSKAKASKKDSSNEGETTKDSSKRVAPDVVDLVAAQAVARAAAAMAASAVTVPGGASDSKPPSSEADASKHQNGATGSAPRDSKGSNGADKPAGKGSKRPKSDRKKGNGATQQSKETKDRSKPRVSDTASTSTVKSTPTAADLVAQAAAAAAAATLANSPGKPARRPALQSRGVRDALSKAGIKKSSSSDGKASTAADTGT